MFVYNLEVFVPIPNYSNIFNSTLKIREHSFTYMENYTAIPMRLIRTSEHDQLPALSLVLAYAATSTLPAYLADLAASTLNAPGALLLVPIYACM